MAVASNMGMALIILGKMVVQEKSGGYKFKFLEVEVDVDYGSPWDGNIGKEITEPVPAEATEP